MESNNHNYNSALDTVIRQVKEEIKSIFFKRKDLIRKLGEAFKHTVSAESICEEIKIALHEEITQGLISTRDIERYCPIEWKKKTRPKKEENDNLSFSRQEQQGIPQLLVDTDGNTVTEPAAIPDPDSNNDVVNHKGSAKEETQDSDAETASQDLESVIKESTSFTIADRQLSEQNRVKELETKIEGLKLELKSRLAENFALRTQAEDLLKSEHDDHGQILEDRIFDVQFQVSFEDLRRHMNSSYKKKIGIAEVVFTAKVNLAKKELTEIQIVDPESLESTN